jgi:hypothetical protein
MVNKKSGLPTSAINGYLWITLKNFEIQESKEKIQKTQVSSIEDHCGRKPEAEP